MSVVGGWLLGPLVLVLLCTGAGLLVEWLARTRLPGPALPAFGLAALVVVAGLLTIGSATAKFAAPACAVVAVAGLVLGRARLRAIPWPPVLVGLVAFAVLAAPSVLSGQASVAGYIKLDDSAIWLGLIAHVMQHGRDISGVPPSTFQLDLMDWLHQGYPIGAFTPVGVTAKLTGQDYANVYQPVICVYGALGALGLYGVVRDLVARPWLAAVAALIGIQASLFVGYVEWGSIKEIAAVPLIAALVIPARQARSLALAALPAGALLDTYGSGGIVWAGTGMIVVGLVLLASRAVPFARYAAGVAGGVAISVVAAIPAIVVLGIDVKQTTGGSPSNQHDIGKLLAPLKTLQGAGLWPAGDFRTLPDPRGPATALAVLGLVLAAGAVGLALKRRRFALPILIGVVIVAAAVGLHVGGPWIDAKVLAITSPFLLTAAATLVVAVPLRFSLPVLAILIVGAVYSTGLVDRDVYIAPRAELIELRALGKQLAGKGPTLVLNYEGYATRYYLGPAQDEGASELRYHQIPNRSGQLFPNYTTAEMDDVSQKALFFYPVIVRRTTPVGSRAPSGYRLIHAGRFFDAWQRDGTPLPTDHYSLGTDLAPGAQLTCPRARAVAAGARTLVAAPLVNPVLVNIARSDVPEAWKTTTGLRPVTDGVDRATVTLPQAGTWRVWVGGQTLGRLKVSVDGHPVGSFTHQLDAAIGWLRYGALHLSAGAHTVTLDYARGWRPGHGDDDAQLPLGPLGLSLEHQPPLIRLPASQVDKLCTGRTYDWLESFG